jgi:hypothetical protein
VVATTDPSSTSTQQWAGSTHEIPDRSSVALGNDFFLFQLLPALVVAITVPLVPTAKQSEVVGQETSHIVAVDVGRFSTVQAVPPSVLATATGAVAVAPRATQSDGVGHETLLRTVPRPGDSGSSTSGPRRSHHAGTGPGAVGSDGDAVRRPFGLAIPPGGLCATHRRPPSVVAAISTLARVGPSPTAKQSDGVGHVMASRKTPFPGSV